MIGKDVDLQRTSAELSKRVISAHDFKAGFATWVLKNEYINKQTINKLSKATKPQILQCGTGVFVVVGVFSLFVRLFVC